MNRRNRRAWALGLVAAALVAGLAAPRVAGAQGNMQLTVPAEKYTLGRFEYRAPVVDGWRQLANIQSTLSMVYAEQTKPETIETRFGVALEAHDIPENAVVADAAALANTSRLQMAEARKDDLVGMSPIEAVPSIENMYTYRLLVRSPIEGAPDAYEVYYVVMSPDKKQYLVAQCITKTQDYANELYFTQFYGSLASIRYVPPQGDETTGSGDDASPAASD